MKGYNTEENFSSLNHYLTIPLQEMVRSNDPLQYPRKNGEEAHLRQILCMQSQLVREFKRAMTCHFQKTGLYNILLLPQALTLVSHSFA